VANKSTASADGDSLLPGSDTHNDDAMTGKSSLAQR
jgi:hypothetical protein